jgi:hypothetical protein
MRGLARAMSSTSAMPFGGLENRMEQDRAGEAGLCLQLGDILIGIVNVPWAFDLRQHDHVELVAGVQHELGDIFLEPGRVQRVHTAPEAGALALPVIHGGHFDGAGAGGILGVGRDCVFQIGEDHVHAGGHVRHLGAYFVEMRRDEVNHPLQLDGKVPHRLRRADGERFEEIARCFL